MRMRHPFHQEHPLVLVEEQSNEGLKAHCDRCGELLSAPCFTCIHCNYHLHKQCTEAPLELPNHPLHPKHSDKGFFLRQRPNPFSGVYGCALCKEKRNMFFYQCLSCWFSIDVKCAQLSSSFKFSQPSKHDIHEHPLTFIESPMAIDVLKRLSCSWCHEPLTNAIYLCPDCPFFILHKKCFDELATKINHPSYHMHLIFLNRSDSGCFCNLCQKHHSGPFYGCTLCHFNINIGCALPHPHFPLLPPFVTPPQSLANMQPRKAETDHKNSSKNRGFAFIFSPLSLSYKAEYAVWERGIFFGHQQ
uniref:DC1 domain-containing protein n=1 Tax=Gossypium raimondii TaxID=29730 RepID=A0A0D2U8I5_GOSRA|nr:hypothetical protein B456_N006200 [Gossypium raimondii]